MQRIRQGAPRPADHSIREVFEPSVSPTPATIDGIAAGLTEARAQLAALLWEVEFIRDETLGLRRRSRASLAGAVLAGGAAGAVCAALVSLSLRLVGVAS